MVVMKRVDLDTIMVSPGSADGSHLNVETEVLYSIIDELRLWREVGNGAVDHYRWHKGNEVYCLHCQGTGMMGKVNHSAECAVKQLEEME